MKKWKVAITTAILLQALTSCTTIGKIQTERLQPPIPRLIDDKGNSQVRLVDGTDIVYMRLEVWKRIVRYINETRPKDNFSKENILPKKPIAEKEELLKLLEEK